MLHLSRDLSTGKTKYTFVANRSQSEHQDVSLLHPYTVATRKNRDDGLDASRFYMIQSFDLLLANIQQKTTLAGFIVNIDGMRDSFASHVLGDDL
jgi:hypothetical protein